MVTFARGRLTSQRLDLSPPVNDTAHPLSTTTTTKTKTKPPKVAEARHLERRHATPCLRTDVDSVVVAHGDHAASTHHLPIEGLSREVL